MAGKKRGLSKGLDALLADTLDLTVDKTAASVTPDVQVSAGFVEINVKQLHPGRFQPRKTIKEAELETLANSIKEQGILQPIVVRNVDDQGYEIIAGERRWRAAQLAGLTTVPVIIKDVSDADALAIALIENIQRENLNPLEEAIALDRLGNEFGLSHAEIADAVGKSRTTVTNLLRILNLQPEVKGMLERGEIVLGHAKVLLGLQGTQQTMVARAVVSKQLSVRETEHMVDRTFIAAPDTAASKPKKLSQDPDIRRLEKRLTDNIGCNVKILQNAKGKGKLQIKYNSLDELDGILAHLMPDNS